jgi:general secretion pathway protein K
MNVADGLTKMKEGRKHNQYGSALIVVLWVVCLLSILVGSFAFDAHVEARITSYFRKRTKAEWLAKSGIEVATMLMIKSADVKSSTTARDKDKDDRWYESAQRLSEGLAVRGLREKLGEGEIELDIIPEPARRNVNLLDTDGWKGVLDVAGVPEEMWEDLINAALYWVGKTADDKAQTEDYYAALIPPYRARRGPIDTVGELLLVKGFDRAILYGGTIKTGHEKEGLADDEKEEPMIVTGIDDMLTTYGGINGVATVNVNAASRRVLMSLLDVDQMTADAIMQEREGWINENGERENTSFKDPTDLFNRVPELSPAARTLVSTESAVFRISSTGIVHGVRRQVWCIARYGNKSLTILRWREQD